ncbi:MAG: hypothetical protein L0Y79_11450 [Chlorobi bacterium]|nr:hypothetical protein [Chlorobiota bacterium]MCI0716762.1 hypothetical protein [Chlorobiota bacterium]
MRTKKVKPPPKKYEYALNITKEYDEISKRDYISFKFNTTKEFLTFQYILKIESSVEQKNLYFNILGFSAPIGELSNPGYAGYEYRMYDYKFTEYNVVVDKKDSAKSKFKLLIQRSKSEPVKLKNIPRKSFIEIKSE